MTDDCMYLALATSSDHRHITVIGIFPEEKMAKDFIGLQDRVTNRKEYKTTNGYALLTDEMAAKLKDIGVAYEVRDNILMWDYRVVPVPIMPVMAKVPDMLSEDNHITVIPPYTPTNVFQYPAVGVADTLGYGSTVYGGSAVTTGYSSVASGTTSVAAGHSSMLLELLNPSAPR